MIDILHCSACLSSKFSNNFKNYLKGIFSKEQTKITFIDVNCYNGELKNIFRSIVTLVRSRVPTSLSKLLFRRQITKRNVSFSNRAKPTKSVTSTFTGDVVLFSIDRYGRLTCQEHSSLVLTVYLTESER